MRRGSVWNRRSAPASWSTSPVHSAGSTRPPTSGAWRRWRARRSRASQALAREVLPLLELRSDFTVSRSELQNIDRGAVDADFESLDRAARQIAMAENAAVMHGWRGC